MSHREQRALARAVSQRGASKSGVVATVNDGGQVQAKFKRHGFRRNFEYDSQWRGRFFATKQVEAIAVEEDGWLVITVMVRFF